jgi:hypothetical protein
VASAFVIRLRELHAKAKAGTIDAQERTEYERSRGEVMRAAFAAQGAGRSGPQRRENIRVALVLKVEIVFAESGVQNATTMDVSTEGFSALLAFAAGTGASARFSIRVPAMDPVVGTCRIAGVTKHGALQRVSFLFDTVDDAARERLSVAMFDHLIQNLP